MNRFAAPDEWSMLLNGLADETLSAKQERRLAELLRTDAEFRRQYVCFCQLLAQLTWQLSAEPESPSLPPNQAVSVEPLRPRRSSRRAWIATAAVLVAAIAWFSWRPVVRERPGRLVRVAGWVEIVRGDQTSSLRPHDVNRNPVQLQLGDRVLTARRSTAVLRLADQTELQIRPQTELFLPADQAGGIGVPSGSLSAKVAPQRPERPLTFFTPQSAVRVLGTELELLASSERSVVAVIEGTVQVTRNADASTATVSAGTCVSVTESGPFAAVDCPRPPVAWSVDFEQGLPPGWTGLIERDALPPGSQGAAAAVRVPRSDEPALQVLSPMEPAGLFAWHDDSMLHLTFKVQPPGWFHIELVTSGYDRTRPLLRYGYPEPDLWQTRPGQWRTVSIPLSEFLLQSYPPDDPALGRIVTQVVFRGESEADGFAIDRIWVDRGDEPAVANGGDVTKSGER